MNHRKEIDGLRAISIIPVILFHAGFQIFSGGFVGVDIFFVISGFLITKIILSDLDSGRFSIAEFYERRARRILPALFFVMATCTIFAWNWLLPREMREFSRSLVAVIIFSSNILFWKESNYFAPSAELKPLLHTWSLAVEEQYYLFFPILLMLAWKHLRRWIPLILVATLVASLSIAQWAATAKPMAGFYLLPSRGWELLIGALISVYIHRTAKTTPGYSPRSEPLSILGFALIVYAIFFFDQQTPFPSVYALVPTVGAGLVLAFGNESTFIGRALGSKILSGIGLISYSAYLWHQPLLAFAKIRYPEHLSDSLLAGLVLASVALAYLTWKYIESPFRHRAKFQRKSIFAMSAAGSAVYLVIGCAGSINNGYETRFSPNELSIAAYGQYDYAQIYRHGQCFLDRGESFHQFDPHCATVAAAQESMLLWGDSYAAALSHGMREIIPHLAQYTASGCPPLANIDIKQRPNCAQINQFVLREVARIQPKKLFLHANWVSYKPEDIPPGLERTLAQVKALSPTTQVIVIGGAPQWQPSLPAYAIKQGLNLQSEHHLPAHNLNRVQLLDRDLAIATKRADASFRSMVNVACIQGSCKASTRYAGAYQLTAWDGGHLTAGGSAYVAARLFPEYAE